MLTRITNNQLLMLVFLFLNILAISGISQKSATEIDYITALKDTLTNVAERSDNKFLTLSCNSIRSVIDEYSSFTSEEEAYLKETYEWFVNDDDPDNPRDLSSYLDRKRCFIFAWRSPSDGVLSFSWLRLPSNWEPHKEYPIYVMLHGYWDVAGNKINHLTYSFRQELHDDEQFNDGYKLSPWGRGNEMFMGAAETDIHECVEYFESITAVDQNRKYLYGFSMGGLGTWHIASRSEKNTWAALATHGAAIWYNNEQVLNPTAIDNLKDIPYLFVCGTYDPNLTVNRKGYQLLQNAGAENIAFIEYPGGHTDGRTEDIDSMYHWLQSFNLQDRIGNTSTHGANSPKVHTNSKGNNIHIYPNPASLHINIAADIPNPENASYRIIDLHGKVVRKNQSFSNNIDISALNKGLYIFELETNDGLVREKILIE